jgi:hypothetical protein
VAQSIVDQAAAANRALGAGPGSVGVVVGATATEVPDLSGLGGPVLVPGIGAQGGQAGALSGLGGAAPGQLLPGVSRRCAAGRSGRYGPASGRGADARCGHLPRRLTGIGAAATSAGPAVWTASGVA